MLLSEIIKYIADNMPISDEYYNKVKKSLAEEIEFRNNRINIENNKGDYKNE